MTIRLRGRTEKMAKETESPGKRVLWVSVICTSCHFSLGRMWNLSADSGHLKREGHAGKSSRGCDFNEKAH